VVPTGADPDPAKRVNFLSGSDAYIVRDRGSRFGVNHKSEYEDVTAWMDSAATPAGVLRIGLAHGSVTSFASEGDATNPIDPRRAKSAGLDYLALGDWHRTLQVGPAAWYAGTLEPDQAGGQEHGTALLVEIAAPGAPPSVTPLTIGTYRWMSRSRRRNRSPRGPLLTKPLCQ